MLDGKKKNVLDFKIKFSKNIRHKNGIRHFYLNLTDTPDT